MNTRLENIAKLQVIHERNYSLRSYRNHARLSRAQEGDAKSGAKDCGYEEPLPRVEVQAEGKEPSGADIAASEKELYQMQDKIAGLLANLESAAAAEAK